MVSVTEEEEEDIDEDLSHDNWEIRMLAAELSRRESRRDEPLSSGAGEDQNASSSGRRQRLQSDTLDTDTENSELEPDRVQRPRAASFDYTPSGARQRCKGFLKAFSFDRDKDQL